MKKVNKVYQVIADRILEAIEAGALPPWIKPWNSVAGGQAANLVSKKAYRGINAMVLSICAQGYKTGWFVSYKQAEKLGGKVRAGEHGFPCIFWTFLKDKDADGNVVTDDKGRPKQHCMTRFYTVFNVDQCDGLEGKYELPDTTKVPEFDTITQAEALIATYLKQNPALGFSKGGGSAFYSPKDDAVTVPNPEDFHAPVNYYATVFHELGHSTGHETRLKRKGIVQFDKFGSEQYGKEELIAELTCAFMCGVAGFEDAIEKNSAAYLKGWLETIKADPAILVESAQGAQKAADYILLTGEEEETEEE